MPELPEVETVCRGLRPELENNTITDIELKRPNLRFPFPNQFKEKIAGRTVEEIERKGKYIIIKFKDCNFSLVWHLGMSGRVIVLKKKYLPKTHEKHEHVIFKTASESEIRFKDPRRFGFMKIIENQDINQQLNLGIEPFSKDFTAENIQKKILNKTKNIKNTLLDQKIIAGLGNI